jgi:hypothetical protein
MNLPSDTSEESGAVAENILRELPADKCRHLAEMIVEHASSLATTMRKSSGWILSSAAWSLVGLEIGGRLGTRFEQRSEIAGGVVLIAVGCALGFCLVG